MAPRRRSLLKTFTTLRLKNSFGDIYLCNTLKTLLLKIFTFFVGGALRMFYMVDLWWPSPDLVREETGYSYLN